MGETIFIEESNQYKQYIENSNRKPLYVGECAPGATVGQSAWRIKKIAYDADGLTASVIWASSAANFDKKWSERATYNYD